MRRLAVAAALLVMGAGQIRARAQAGGDRPSEKDIFGGSAPVPGKEPDAGNGPDAAPAPGASPSSGAPPAATVPPAAQAAGTERDQALLGNSGGASQFLADYVAPENPLQIGGQVYLRAQSTASGHQYPDAWALSAPSLLDVYLDARPNPRVRGFVLGRMAFDPTLPVNVNTMTNVPGGALTGTSATGFTSFSTSRGPTVLLDQMWIRFDVLEKVFVTAGKQHVRWGTGRFWQPTDYLHALRRNPLDVFDARGGTTMLKLNVPWEEKAWNFYGFAVAENPNAPTPTLGDAAAAFRVEGVVAGVELGADTYLSRSSQARYGFDLSTGIWDFDVYADVGIRPGSDFDVYFPATNQVGGFAGYQTQAVGGIGYSQKYNDNDMWTAGVEYFYNSAGYSSASVYPQAIQFAHDNPALVPNPFSLFPFFYLGRQYGAVYVSLPAPYSWNYTTFTLSTLGNLSDRSFVTRLDYSVTILTHLSVEAFVAVHYGNAGGELRFQLPSSLVTEIGAPSIFADYPLFDLGAALRLKI